MARPTPRWSPTLPFRPTAKNLLFALAFAGGVVVAASASRFKHYVDADPRFCATCHRASPEFALWTEGSHKNISCQSCHHASAGEGVAMLRAFVSGRSPSGSHGEVEVGACASCHDSHDARWPQIGGSPGHRIHVQEHGIACVRCHGTTVHGFEPVAASCASCHPGHAVGLEGMQKLHCFACHQFLSSEHDLRPTRRDCLRCHAAQGVRAPFREHGGPMEMSCAACHHPHASGPGALVACTSCHAEMAKGGLHANRGHARARCIGCHQPHLWTASESDCARCHANAADHAEERSCTSCHRFGGAPLPTRRP